MAPSQSFDDLGIEVQIIIFREKITCCCLVDGKLGSATGYSCESYIRTGMLPTLLEFIWMQSIFKTCNSMNDMLI